MNLFFKLIFIVFWMSSCKESGSKTSKRSLEDLEKQYTLNLSTDKLFENLESIRSLYGDSVYISDIYIIGIDTTKAENKIVDIICNSNEVEEKRKFLKRQSNSLQNFICEIWRKPTERSPYYWIKVLNNNGGHILTYFNFFVRLFPFEILYYDEDKDQKIDLRIWKKNFHR